MIPAIAQAFALQPEPHTTQHDVALFGLGFGMGILILLVFQYFNQPNP